VKSMKHLARLAVVPIILLAMSIVSGLGGASPQAYAACPPIAGYPTFGFDTGRTSYNPYECTITPSAAPPFNWISPFSLPSAPREGISTDSTQGYVGVGNAMEAFKLASGTPAWSFPTAGPIVGAATVYLGNIYFGSQSGVFYALNPVGSPICATYLGAPISTTPIGFQNTIVVSTSNGRVFGVNATTCGILWSTPILGLSISSPSLYAGIAFVSVHLTSAQSVVYGIYALTGGIIGSSAPMAGTFTTPVVLLQHIYVGTDNPATSVVSFLLTSPTFAVSWVRSIGEPVYGKPAVDTTVLAPGPSQVYAVSAVSGRLYAFNALTGAINWAAAATCAPLYKAASPTVANGGVYVGSITCINAFKITGGLTWSISVGTLVDSPATVVNGMLLFSANIGGTERIFSF
jgi:outer membrane protein assembly factor BamB